MYRKKAKLNGDVKWYPTHFQHENAHFGPSTWQISVTLQYSFGNGSARVSVIEMNAMGSAEAVGEAFSTKKVR